MHSIAKVLVLGLGLKVSASEGASFLLSSPPSSSSSSSSFFRRSILVAREALCEGTITPLHISIKN
jgi:hypothetical protein